MQLSAAHVEEAIRRGGPRQAFDALIAANNALIRQPELENGRAIASARSVIYTELVRDWAEEQHHAFGYDKSFAVVALGGTGRGEMTPCSDTDFAFLFDDVLEKNLWLEELQSQVLHTDAFRERCGFVCQALPFNLDDAPSLAGKQLNAFLDLRPVYDPTGLAERFRERIQATYDPFEHFLHVRSFWREQWAKAASECERLDRFDIKNDGLRVFLAGIWTLAGKEFCHSHDVYRTLDDPRDLQAYDFLLRIRSFVHSRRAPPDGPGMGGNHLEDVLTFEDFTSFGELLGPEADAQRRFEFANEVRARLLAARRRVAQFTQGVIERELKLGRPVSPRSPILYGVGGLSYPGSPELATPRERSRAALSLLLASQRYGVPIDPSDLQGTFRNAGDWLVRTPELAALFYDQRGSLADSFAFLAQFDGAEDRLFPGYARFEASLDSRVMAERKSLRGALERQKIRILERYLLEGRAMLARAVSPTQPAELSRLAVEVEAALLDAEHLAAVKLALKTKRLPLLPDDLVVRQDETRPLHERFSSGMSDVPLEAYYEPYRTEADFTPETVSVAKFLVTHRRAFKARAETAINDAAQVEEFAQTCGDEHRLRSLFVFTHADRAEWESEQTDPTRWFNTRELYCKTMTRFRPGADPTRSLETAGFSPEQLVILRDFGKDFFDGVYRQFANRFGAHLVQLAEAPETGGPKAGILHDGTSTIIGVAARDYRGLAASITGALWRREIHLEQAHLFSAAQYHLALDFFHVGPASQSVGPRLTRSIAEAIQQRLYIDDAAEAALPQLRGRASLQPWRPGQYCLRFDTSQDDLGLIYALSYKVFRYLRGNIFGLACHTARGNASVSAYLSLPPDLSFPDAQAIVAERFGG